MKGIIICLWKVDRVLANHSLSSTASQGTSNIPVSWFFRQDLVSLMRFLLFLLSHFPGHHYFFFREASGRERERNRRKRRSRQERRLLEPNEWHGLSSLFLFLLPSFFFPSLFSLFFSTVLQTGRNSKKEGDRRKERERTRTKTSMRLTCTSGSS